MYVIRFQVVNSKNLAYHNTNNGRNCTCSNTLVIKFDFAFLRSDVSSVRPLRAAA